MQGLPSHLAGCTHCTHCTHWLPKSCKMQKKHYVFHIFYLARLDFSSCKGPSCKMGRDPARCKKEPCKIEMLINTCVFRILHILQDSGCSGCMGAWVQGGGVWKTDPPPRGLFTSGQVIIKWSSWQRLVEFRRIPQAIIENPLGKHMFHVVFHVAFSTCT